MGVGSESRIRGGWIGAAMAAFAILSLPGCGGRTMLDDGPICDATKGCGGNIEGDWSVRSMCFFVDTSSPTAPSPTGNADCDAVVNAAFASAVVTPVDATVSFHPDIYSDQSGTFTGSGHVHVKATYLYTAACLAASGAPPPSPDGCDQLTSEVRSTGYDGSCTFRNDECVCHLEKDQYLGDASSYETQGTNINFLMSGQVTPYCVHGNQAKIGTPPSLGFTGTMLLEKQPPQTL